MTQAFHYLGYGQRVVLLKLLKDLLDSFEIVISLCFGKVSVEWRMFIDVFLHALIDMRELT